VTEDCAADLRNLKTNLSIKDEENPEGDLVVKGFGCIPVEEAKTKT
jgi:hypothetical protein